METVVVEFPNIGFKIPVSRVAFSPFGVDIFWYGIIIAAAFLVAVLLAMRDSRKFGFEPDHVLDLVLFAAPAAIVAARLYYVIFDLDSFNTIWDIVNTRKGGLAIYGGIIGAFVVGYLFARKKKLGILNLFDFAIPYIPLGQAIGRWGNFVNQEAFGANTNLPWGMRSNATIEYLSNPQVVQELADHGIQVNPLQTVHPTFLYESLWNFAVFFFLIWYRKRKKADGEVFFLYMVLYGIGRAWIEGMRTDSLWLGNLRISQVLAVVFAIVFAAILYITRRKMKQISDGEISIGASEYGTVLMKLKQEEGSPAAADSQTHGAGEGLVDVEKDNNHEEDKPENLSGESLGEDNTEENITANGSNDEDDIEDEK